MTDDPAYISSLRKAEAHMAALGLPITRKVIKRAIDSGHLKAYTDTTRLDPRSRPRTLVAIQDLEAWLQKSLKPYVPQTQEAPCPKSR